VINLIIRSMEILCDSKEGGQLFSSLFRMIDNIKTDEEMQESIIWLVNSMVEQGET
jgi:hypothetical protein